jgi:hypothetical protein
MYGLHIVEAKVTDKPMFTFAGSIPISICTLDVASKSDVMAQRAFRDKYGLLVAPKIPYFSNLQDAVNHAKSNGHAPIYKNIKQ